MTAHDMTAQVPSARHPEDSIAEVLRDQIRSGSYKAGDWLPTERKLAENLRVDRRVVRLAINRLVSSGLVIRQPHCRPIVAALPEEAPAPAPAPALPAASFVALLMWHGGQIERTMTSQQRIFWGMNQALADAGLHAVFLDLGEVYSEEENKAREADRLRYILKQGFGGAVFYPYAYHSNTALIESVRQAVPFVAIDRRCVGVETDFVGVDNYGAMYDTVKHLVNQGHRRIAYVTKSEQIVAVQERTRGYLDAMRDADLNDTVLPISIRESEQKWSVIETVFRLPAEERPTAAAVFNDHSAFELAERLELLGLSVPGDVALTGFDDIVPTLSSGVGLTTAAQPYEEIGRKAAELILRRMKDPSAPVLSVDLPAPLIIRESSQSYRQQQ